jgi:hypothetical protein
MKKTKPVLEPLLVDTRSAAQLLARRALFTRMVEAGWIRPVVSSHKCKLFALADIRRCAQRLKKESLPCRALAPSGQCVRAGC